MQVQFAQPQWLWIGALVSGALLALAIRAARKRRAAIQVLAAASAETSLATRRRWLREGLALAGVAFGFIALARPRAGYHLEQAPHHGVDLMFAVDTSKSMLAADLRPNRLTRAKLAVADLVKTFDGERVGLIAFAGDAFVQAPMTADRGVFLEALDALDTDIIPRGGTDLAAAIRAAAQAMGSEPDHKKVLVMLTDGEDLAGNAIDAARDAAKHGLTIDTVGVGSTAGELIEVAAADGTRALVRDDAGQPVRSRLDESTLRAIAQATGGAYQPLGADGRGLEALYAAARATLPRSAGAGDTHRVYTERYQIALALALLCLVGELALGDRRRRRALGTAGLSLTLGLALFGMPRVAAADPARAGTPVTDYNAGTATYRKGDFASAQAQFEAALHTGDVALQISSYYDLGNARYRAGQATLAKHDRDATIATWKQSIASYDAALALAPKDADATFNRDFVAKQLAALEQQKRDDEQKKQDDDRKKQDQQQQKQQQSKNGKSQSQPNSGQQQQQQQGKSGQQPQQQQGNNGQQPQQGNNGQQPQQGNNGQQPQQGNNGQQPQQQGNNGAQPKDQQGSGASPKQDAPDAAAQRDGTRPDTASVGTAGAKPAGDAKADAAAAAADAARRAAGDLTRGEAVQLLDSVESELKPMPIHGRKGAHVEQTKIRDW